MTDDRGPQTDRSSVFGLLSSVPRPERGFLLGRNLVNNAGLAI